MQRNVVRVVGLFAGAVFLAAAPVARGESAEATVTGKVAFKGAALTPKPINFGAEQQCKALHGDSVPMLEDIVVNADGTLKNALVYVKEGISGQFEAPKEVASINQAGCVFLPHVMAVMVGQPVEFTNSDPVLHNVRSQSKQGQSFNIAQPVQGMKTTRAFKKPEIGIPVRCDVHFWMVSYLHALPHPFFAVTGDDGAFKIQGLPPGTYVLEAWHEKLGTRTGTLSLKAGEKQTLDFTYEQE